MTAHFAEFLLATVALVAVTIEAVIWMAHPPTKEP